MMTTFATEVPLERLVRHAGTIRNRRPLTFESTPQPWAYTASVPLALEEYASKQVDLPIKVSAKVTVDDGTLGCLLVADDWVTLLGGMPPAMGPGRHTVNVIWERGDGRANLVFRNHAANQPCVFRVESVQVEPAPPDPLTRILQLEDVMDNSLERIDVAKLQKAVEQPELAISDEADVFDLLRRKWGVVPAGLSERRSTQDLLASPAEELREFWIATHTKATTGEGFSVRGWYHALYREVLRGKKVLEIGSGMGIDGIEFARHGAQMTFVDIVPENLAVMRRLCDIFSIGDARFVQLERFASLDVLENDYDVVFAQGSLINAPFSFTKRECAAILPHLKPGGRWIELAYPRERWVRDGQPPFRAWGTMTDGEGTPWVEWYDLARVLRRLEPATFAPILAMNFHDDDFNWFDLVKVE
jgi:SAM-dependent methyltransferase